MRLQAAAEVVPVAYGRAGPQALVLDITVARLVMTYKSAAKAMVSSGRAAT